MLTTSPAQHSQIEFLFELLRVYCLPNILYNLNKFAHNFLWNSIAVDHCFFVKYPKDSIHQIFQSQKLLIKHLTSILSHSIGIIIEICPSSFRIDIRIEFDMIVFLESFLIQHCYYFFLGYLYFPGNGRNFQKIILLSNKPIHGQQPTTINFQIIISTFKFIIIKQSKLIFHEFYSFLYSLKIYRKFLFL